MLEIEFGDDCEDSDVQGLVFISQISFFENVEALLLTPIASSLTTMI